MFGTYIWVVVTIQVGIAVGFKLDPDEIVDRQKTMDDGGTAYVKTAGKHGCCINGNQYHQRCTCMLDLAACKANCDADVACKGYAESTAYGGSTCQLATAGSCPSDCSTKKLNIDSIGNLDPKGTCGSFYTGCFIKQSDYEKWTCEECQAAQGFTYCQWIDQFNADGGCLPNVYDGRHVPCGQDAGDVIVNQCPGINPPSPPTTPSPPTPPTPAVTYTKKPKKYCNKKNRHGKTKGTLAEAKDACTKDKDCYGVYDVACKQKVFYACNLKDKDIRDSKTSTPGCIYEKV